MKTVTVRFDDDKRDVVSVCPGISRPWRNLYYRDGKWFLGFNDFETELEARERADSDWAVAVIKIDLKGLEV